jgi:predicted acyl esterase
MLLNACAGDDQTPPGAYDSREHYTKYEYRIPMRDGVRLFTSVLVPKMSIGNPVPSGGI